MTPDIFGPAAIVPSPPAPKPAPQTWPCECGKPERCPDPPLLGCSPEGWAAFWRAHPFRAGLGRSRRSYAADANLARQERRR